MPTFVTSLEDMGTLHKNFVKLTIAYLNVYEVGDSNEIFTAESLRWKTNYVFLVANICPKDTQHD